MPRYRIIIDNEILEDFFSRAKNLDPNILIHSLRDIRFLHSNGKIDIKKKHQADVYTNQETFLLLKLAFAFQDNL